MSEGGDENGADGNRGLQVELTALCQNSEQNEAKGDTSNTEGGEKQWNHQYWFHWFWNDMKNTNLIWVKLVFFLQTASLVTLYPYLAIQERFEADEVALVNSAIPVADIFGPPLAGYLADKIGNFRIFMSSVTFLNGFSALLLTIVPEMAKESFDLRCYHVDESELQCFNLDSKRTINYGITHFGNGCSNPENFRLELVPISNATFPTEQYSKFFTDDFLSCSTRSGNWHLTFWSYLAARVTIDILRASSLMLFEGAVVAIIKAKNGDYGLQKLFCTFGGVIFGPLAGKVIDWTGGNYDSIVYLFFAQRLAAALAILKISLSFKPPGKGIVKDAVGILCKLKVLNFLVGYFAAGIVWGFIETFLFWLLQDLGASSFLMGLSLAMGTLTGLPLTIFSSLIIEKLGHEVIMVVSLAVYSARLIGYGLMDIPELTLLYEALKPICTSLLTIATFSFIKEESSLTTATTLSGIFGALHYGIGKGIGGFAGGFSIQSHGNQITFLTFAGFALSTSVTCSLVVIAIKCMSKHTLNVDSSTH